MAKASLVAAKTANDLAELKEQLKRIEEMLERLLGQTNNKPAQEVTEKKK